MAPARSQRYSTRRNNQPQPGPSQVPLTQGSDDDEPRQEEEVDADANMDQDVGGAESEVHRKAADLVRLALFAEQRRTVLRREEITKKVLGSNPRLFNQTYAIANTILHRTFGMELVELPSRANINQNANDADGQEDELDRARAAAGIRKKEVVAAGSKTYMLRSTLDPQLIELAAQTDKHILEAEAKEALDDEEDEDFDFSEGGYTPRYHGSIISWTRGEQPGAIGILYIILALILVNGRVVSDMDLRANLKRLRLPSGGEVAFSALSTHKTLTIDQYLLTLMRQNYIDKEQVGDAKNTKGKGTKRGRVATQAAAQDDEEGVTYQWRWGPRAYCEVGEKAIAQFIAEVMVGERIDVDADDEDEGGRAESSRRGRAREHPTTETKLQKMLDGIERAAGGTLMDLK